MESKKDEPHVRVVDRRWWARSDNPEAAAEEAAARKPTYVEDLERRLADTTAQLQAVAADRKRALEEFDQVKARMRRDTARETERGRRAVFTELLDVIDNLDRALAAAASPADPFVQGVALVRDQLLRKLQTFGVVRVPALGQPFDATRHEAVGTAPVADPTQDGLVVAVLKDGYAAGGDVLRPAAVIVGTIAEGRGV